MLLESLSLASADPREDEIPPVGASHAIPPSPFASAVTSTPEVRAEQNIDTVTSPQSRSLFKKWLHGTWKSNKGPTPPRPSRLSGKSREPAGPPSPSHSPARVNATKGPSWMAAGKRRPVSVLSPDVACLTCHSSEWLQHHGQQKRF